MRTIHLSLASPSIRIAAVRIAAALGLAAALASTGLMAGPAQEQTAGQQPRPTFRVEANFIRVDAFVTRDGVPVQDLRLEDFEILEDGRPQKIATFEHVIVRAAVPQMTRVEPNTVRESEAMAADPRARVFILFLDTHHVTVEGSYRIKQPLVRLLDRVIGQDDLVAVMTPHMSPKDLALARKMTTIEGMLEKAWHWGERERTIPPDPQEYNYQLCYAPERGFQGVALEMIERRREKRTLDAFEELVSHLGSIREERKAVLTISEGWLLYRPNLELARLGRQGPPGRDPIYVGPGGKPAVGTDPRWGYEGLDVTLCERDRLFLAMLDNDQQFRDLLGRANRANVSFYSIDPAGLRVFDSSIGSERARESPAADVRRLQERRHNLRTIAEATDGLAVVGTNDVETPLKRIVDDLQSYYLIGYYSPAGTDGRYHNITVKVKRPGVSVRSRKGYRAAKLEELKAVADVSAPVVEETRLVEIALGGLAAVRPGMRLHLRAAPGVHPTNGRLIWVVGELDSAARTMDWMSGATAQIDLVAIDGRRIASETANLPGGTASFVTTLGAAGGLQTGSYTVRVRVRPAIGGDVPIQDALQLHLAATPEGIEVGRPLIFRRGPSTGIAYAPTADPRFRRTERVRLELCVDGPVSRIEGRLLDRNGRPIALPIAISERTDPPEGPRWLVGDLTLAPLGVGDYVVELAFDARQTRQRVLTAIRVIP